MLLSDHKSAIKIKKSAFSSLWPCHLVKASLEAMARFKLLLVPTKNHRKGADIFLLKASEELGPIIQSASGSENES